jgi:hypothetical protein
MEDTDNLHMDSLIIEAIKQTELSYRDQPAPTLRTITSLQLGHHRANIELKEVDEGQGVMGLWKTVMVLLHQALGRQLSQSDVSMITEWNDWLPELSATI